MNLSPKVVHTPPRYKFLYQKQEHYRVRSSISKKESYIS